MSKYSPKPKEEQHPCDGVILLPTDPSWLPPTGEEVPGTEQPQQLILDKPRIPTGLAVGHAVSLQPTGPVTTVVWQGIEIGQLPTECSIGSSIAYVSDISGDDIAITLEEGPLP